MISNHKFAGQAPYPIRVLDDGTSTNESRLGAVRDILFAVESLQQPEDVFVMAGDICWISH